MLASLLSVVLVATLYTAVTRPRQRRPKTADDHIRAGLRALAKL